MSRLRIGVLYYTDMFSEIYYNVVNLEVSLIIFLGEIACLWKS